MGGLFLVLVVIPAVAVIAFLVAVFWGLLKARNKRRYFISMGLVVTAILLFASTAFIDYKTFIVNTFAIKHTPSKYKDYDSLRDSVNNDYSITLLCGDYVDYIFEDSLSGNIIVGTRGSYQGADFYCHRIDSAGHLLGSYMITEELSPYGRLLFGKAGYCDWISTGDSITKPFVPIVDTLNRESMKRWYDDSEYVYFSYDNSGYLIKDGVWYSFNQNFKNGYSSDEDFPSKVDYAFAHTNSNIPRIRDDMGYEGVILFSKCPSTIAGGAFEFEYFDKDDYQSGFRHLFSGIGSPTGGSGDSGPRWYGTAYCKLRVGDKYVPFASSMTHYTQGIESFSYEMKMLIYTQKRFAIVSGDYQVALILAK